MTRLCDCAGCPQTLYWGYPQFDEAHEVSIIIDYIKYTVLPVDVQVLQLHVLTPETPTE